MLGQCEDGRKIWLEGPAVPGDQVEFELNGKTGVITGIPFPSQDRIPSFCPHFDRCPGCQLQPLPYEKQLELKGTKIVEALRRLGGFNDIPFLGVEASPDLQGNRNKLDFTVEGNQLGYQSREGLLPIDQCPVGGSLLNMVLADVSKWLQAHPRHQVHRLILRVNGARDRVHILLRGVLGNQEEIDFVQWAKEHDNLSGLSIQEDWKSDWENLYGHPELEFTLAGQMHSIPYDAFFQVNDRLADQLVRETLDWLEDGSKKSVLDLFCGAGAFTLPIQEKGFQVLGLDTRPGKGPFQKADLRKGIPVKILKQRWHTVVTDPPRSGMEKELCRHLRDEVRPERLLYISCNPATLARDLQRVCTGGDYELTRVKGFDIFPHTTHVETLVELARKH